MCSQIIVTSSHIISLLAFFLKRNGRGLDLGDRELLGEGRGGGEGGEVAYQCKSFYSFLSNSQDVRKKIHNGTVIHIMDLDFIVNRMLNLFMPE